MDFNSFMPGGAGGGFDSYMSGGGGGDFSSGGGTMGASPPADT